MRAGAAAAWTGPVMTAAKAPPNKGRIDLGARMRECLQCDGWLPFAAFSSDRTRPGGIKSTCRECCERNRRDAGAAVWAQCLAALGGACARCRIDVPITLHPDPKSEWGRRFRGAGRERKTATLARMILNMGADARKHFGLICANCELRRRHGDTACPR